MKKLPKLTTFDDHHTIERCNPTALKKEAWDKGIQISGYEWKLSGPLVDKYDTYHPSFKAAMERLEILRERGARAHRNALAVKKAGLAKATALEEASGSQVPLADRRAAFARRLGEVEVQYQAAQRALEAIAELRRNTREMVTYLDTDTVTFEAEVELGGGSRTDTFTYDLSYLNSIKD